MESRAQTKKFSEVQLLCLLAIFHTLPLFYLRMISTVALFSRAYSRTFYAP